MRYDGSEFRVFRHTPADPASLGDNRVRSIVEDSQGNLWLATEGAGLAFWDRKLERFSHFRQEPGDPAGLHTDYIRCLLKGKDGWLWVGTYGDGLLRFDTQQRRFQRIELSSPVRRNLASDRILTLCEDHHGRLWIGTEGEGLIELDPSTQRTRTFMPDPTDVGSLISATVRVLCEDPQGQLWVGTERGLARLDTERRHFEVLEIESRDATAPEPPIVDALMAEADGRVWVGTDGKGLSQFDPMTGRFTPYRRVRYSPESLSSDVVRTVYRDRQQNLWVGTYPDSVHLASPLNAAFQTYRSIPGQTNTLNDDAVASLLEGKGGEWWVGTDRGGLNRVEPRTMRWSSVSHDPGNPASLAASAVLSLFEDAQGRLWIGTWGGGLDRLDPGSAAFVHYAPAIGQTNRLSSPHVWAITEDLQHQIWVATSAGVNRFVPEKDSFVVFRHDPANERSLNHDYARCLLVTRAGALWVGTHQGLARWNPSSQDWDRLRNQPGDVKALQNASVLDLLEDRRGNIWVGTQGKGLCRLDPKTRLTEWFTTRDGLASDIVAGVLEDFEGGLWVATNDGLSRFDPERRRFQTYGETYGLQGRRFHSGSRVRLRSGDLLFGGTEGFSRVTPSAIKQNDLRPPVVLTGLEISGETILPGMPDKILTQSITETRELAVPAGTTVISLQFAALNYRSPEQNQYMYQLVGFDSGWRKVGTEKRATYTNLDPGRYRFRVRASNDEGVWNEEGAVLELTVVPRYWQTGWFRLGVLMSLVGGFVTAGWGVANVRARGRLREAARERALAIERQQAAEALRESELRYRELFEHANDGIGIVQDGVVKIINKRFAALCGYPLEEVMGKPLSGFVYPEDRSLVLGRHAKRVVGDEGLPEAYRFRLTRQSGAPIWVELNTTVIHWEGRPATLNVVRDIRERLRNEEERLKLERQMLELQKSESLGVLAGGIAHDFNNLLTIILGNTDLALQDLPPNTLARESLDGIREASLRAADLCRQMLAYSGRGKFQIQLLDLTKLVEEMVNLLRTSISKKATLDLQLQAGLPTLRGDPTQIRQIVMNLVINASEAMGDNPGVLTLTTGTMTCSTDYLQRSALHEKPAPGSYVWLEVADTGCGMNSETQRRIFEPFFTTKFAGRGLGLSAVLGIVRGHQGALMVDSEPGKGTRFRVLLPAAPKESGDREAAPEASQPWRGAGTVLLVDDEEGVRGVGRRVLERLGFQVITAMNGKESVAIYREKMSSIRLVIMDLTMPEMGGEEACRELLRLNPKVRVLLASGYSETDLASRFADLAVSGFIEKPYTVDLLSRHLRAALEGAA